MKTIKIFLASSEELDYDRMAFGNLVRRLDDMYEKRGIRIKLFEWEDYDSAYNDKRKQDEYNEHVCQSDFFLALFHKKAGQFTIEEFNKASEQFKATASPKVYTFCKDLKPGEEETPELKEFKKRLFDEMGHYWCRYDNRESLHLQFVMQLQLVESSQMADMKVEGGNITLNGLPIAPMDKLKFAACNEEYLKMNEELASLPPKIEKARLRLEKFPDDEDLQDDLQSKLNRYNQLKKDFEEYQQILFNTAKRIAQLQGERITERMRRAMDAFNEGRVHEANIILDEAKEDARRDFDEFKHSVEITEIKRLTVINHIKEKLFNASSIMADAVIPIENRIQRAEELYEEAYKMAKYKHVEYEKDDFGKLLFDYADFLYKYAIYDKSLKYYTELVSLCINKYGAEHLLTAKAYNGIAIVYGSMDNHSMAMDYFLKALTIREKLLGIDDIDTANTYYQISVEYAGQGNYSKALEFNDKAIRIQERILGELHIDTAKSYDHFGTIYGTIHDYPKALDYFAKALTIREKIINKDSSSIEWSYDHIGTLYFNQGDSRHALEYYNKALEIRINIEGEMHPHTAWSYNNIGTVHLRYCNYPLALTFFKKALYIQEKVLGKEHSDTAWSYEYLAQTYEKEKDYSHALDYYLKTLTIRESVLGKDHLYTARSYYSIGLIYTSMGEYLLAINNYCKALNIYTHLLDKTNQGKTFYKLGAVYSYLGDDSKANEYYYMAAYCYKEAAEKGIIEAQEELGEMYELGKGIKQNYKLATEWYLKAAEQNNVSAQYNLGEMYEKGKGVEKDLSIALKWYNKAAEQGHTESECTLGWMYDNGVGVEENHVEALRWFFKAAEKGNITAQHNIGYMYLNGIGTEKDDIMAFDWFSKAAEGGDADSQIYIALLYCKGRGTEQDYEKSVEWLTKAAEQDNKDAYNNLAWTYHLMGKYEEALPWAEKAVAEFPNNPDNIDTLATIYQGLGRYDEAMEQFELCLKLYKEKENSEGIQRTEEKIAALKELMHQGKTEEYCQQ